MFDIARFRSRWLIFSALLALPVLRLLVAENYGFFHLEVAAIVFLAALVAALLAATTPRARIFHAVALTLIFVLSIDAVRASFWPDARLRLLVPLWALAVGGAFALLRDNFYKIVLIFLAGTFLADVGKAIYERGSQSSAMASTTQQTGRKHVIHIVLDEMLGLAALPPECAGCQKAKSNVEAVLNKGNFRTYSHAFSNYAVTRDSLSSLLNHRILDRCYQFVPAETENPVLRENAYFDQYAAKGYDIRVYQSDHILYNASKHRNIPAMTYKIVGLSALNRTNLDWSEKSKEILTYHFRSNKIWRGLWEAYIPPQWHFKETKPGPLTLAEFWPMRVLDDIGSANKDTLFFVHLMIPHFPYVYDENGGIRNPRDWYNSSSLFRLRFTEGHESEYQKAYGEYSLQVQELSRQLDAFFESLRKSGQYDSSTILVHGDHGSRMRFVNAKDQAAEDRIVRELEAACPISSAWYSYADAPDTRDLLNRFATLFAIKPAGSTRPEMIAEKRSVMDLLWQNTDAGSASVVPSSAQSVYLFDTQGRPRAIPLTQLWN